MDLDPVAGIQYYLVFLFSTCCHEAAHAWTSRRLGDDTAHRGGQVTLDPTPHIKREPFGMVVVPILSYVLGGWMIGWASAPYDPNWAMRHPRRAGLMALAGPAANVTLALIAVVIMRIGVEWDAFRIPASSGFRSVVAPVGATDGMLAFLCHMLSLIFSMNVLLAAFNLLPAPPLDGSSIPLLFLAEDTARKYWAALRNPALALIGLIAAWKIMGVAFPALFGGALKLLYITLSKQ